MTEEQDLVVHPKKSTFRKLRREKGRCYCSEFTSELQKVNERNDTDIRVVLNVLRYSNVLGTLGDCICALTEKTDHSKTPGYSLKEQLSRKLNKEKQKAIHSCNTHKNQSGTVVASWWFYMFT